MNFQYKKYKKLGSYVQNVLVCLFLSTMLFTTNDLNAQSKQDSLYNSFPIEITLLPYPFGVCGSGSSRNLRSDVVLATIYNAFKESGIELEREVLYSDNGINVRLTGYSKQDKIGFIFIDHRNFSYPISNERQMVQLKVRNIKELKKSWLDSVEREFQGYQKDKTKYIAIINKYRSDAAAKKYVSQLKLLAPETTKAFFPIYLNYELNTFQESYGSQTAFIDKVIQYIDNRFDDSVEKLILFRYSATRLKDWWSYSKPFQIRVEKVFDSIIKKKSDKQFIDKLLILNTFVLFNSASYLGFDKEYLNLKIGIMNDHSIDEWLTQIDKLSDYRDQVQVSIAEANAIDEKNKSGSFFVAPIGVEDSRLIDGFYLNYEPEHLYQEVWAIQKELYSENGVTPEIQKKKQVERVAIHKKYSSQVPGISRKTRDSLGVMMKIDLAALDNKYEEMELLSEEEKAIYQAKIEAVNKRIEVWKQEKAITSHQETLRRLENDVKMYIKWAKAQMRE